MIQSIEIIFEKLLQNVLGYDLALKRRLGSVDNLTLIEFI